MSKEPFRFTICAMCGKEFIKQPGSIYHVEYKGRINQCCSYTCYQKAIRVKEKLRYEAKQEKEFAKRQRSAE